jgi:hypothetical protein
MKTLILSITLVTGILLPYSLAQSQLDQVSAFQAAPRKTIITENSIHTIKPIAAATPL